jgi:hypothetical protein
MGKYDKASYRTPPPQRPWKIHPIWRGIGCLWFLISPVLAYAIASLLVNYDLKTGFFPIPTDLTRQVTIPFARIFPRLSFFPITIPNLTVPHLYANLLVSSIILVVGFGAVMVIYAILYSMMGPKRLGPLDAPSIRRKTRKSR